MVAGRHSTGVREQLGDPVALMRLLYTLAAALILGPGVAAGQRLSIGPTIQHVFDGGAGVERSCLESGHSTGVGGRASYTIASRLTLEFTTRAYFLEAHSTCVDGFPPGDGTYVQDDHINLLAASFLTTDVRLRARFGSQKGGIGFALGLGNAWRSSHDLPYALLGTSIHAATGHRVGLVFEAEYLILRVTYDRHRRTYQNGSVVADEFLGRMHQGSHALTVGAGLEVAL